jgi:tetratricopeptide (TPR) repeat protein
VEDIAELYRMAARHGEEGDVVKCAEACEAVLRRVPDHLPALDLLAQCRLRGRNYAGAAECLTRLLRLAPDYAEGHCNLGTAKQQMGLEHEAAEHFRAALRLRPGFAEAHYNLGNTLRILGNDAEALACYAKAVELRPTFTEAWVNRALVHFARGEWPQAIVCYQEALQLQPDNAKALNGLGTALQQQGQLERAITCYRDAIRAQPRFAEAHNNLGMALVARKEIGEAKACFERALALDPAVAPAHVNLGNLLRDEGRTEEAIAHFEQAIALRPDVADTYHGLGVAYHDRGDFAKAEECYRAALARDQNLATARASYGTQKLLLGDLEAGFADYEWRRRIGDTGGREFLQPQWDGRPLEGKTILLHTEQGLGDTLQFVRYAAIPKAHGARVLVRVQPELLRLLASCSDVDQLFARGDALPEFDVQAPLLSLPLITKTTWDSIPRNTRYLRAEADRVARWRERLVKVRGYRIGIHWRGRDESIDARKRNIPLDYFVELSNVGGVQLISLQKGVTAAEVAAAGEDVRFLESVDAEGGAFVDTAAIMNVLDLVITSDTSVAHLAGALGVPVWVALPQIPDWRWFLDRTDSPWYPTMRLFRQRHRGEWRDVFEEIRAALYCRLESRREIDACGREFDE